MTVFTRERRRLSIAPPTPTHSLPHGSGLAAEANVTPGGGRSGARSRCGGCLNRGLRRRPFGPGLGWTASRGQPCPGTPCLDASSGGAVTHLPGAPGLTFTKPSSPPRSRPGRPSAGAKAVPRQRPGTEDPSLSRPRRARRGSGRGRPASPLPRARPLREVPLEAGGRDDLEQARLLVAGIPEGAPPGSRPVDQIAGPAWTASPHSIAPTRTRRTWPCSHVLRLETGGAGGI